MESDTAENSRRERIDKFAERRAELAQAAVQTLSELGYARSSLREIAQNSEFSHGVLHYYFKDKVDLIACCVRRYKAHSVSRYDRIIVDTMSYDELLKAFLDTLTVNIKQDAHLHRLWYDLRSQALFEPAFQADVAEIDKSLEQTTWRLMRRFYELAGLEVEMPPSLLYALLDGIFQQSLLKHFSGESGAIEEMLENVRVLAAKIFDVPPSSA